MANALDQAVETAEAQNDAPTSQEEDGQSVASTAPPTEASDAPPESDPPAAPDAESADIKVHKSGIPQADRGEAQAPFDPAHFPPVVLNNRYLIHPSMALPDLNSPSAMAYSAEDRREPGRQLFALICKPGLPVRTRLMTELKTQTVNGMVPMSDFGPVFWGPIEQTSIAIVFERPLGGRFLDKFGDNPPRVNEYELGKLVIAPIAQAIQELAQFDFAHRAIRLDNLFFMDKEQRELVVGECLTSPPGYDQPCIYEPLDRAYAMPSGRGAGFSYDDMYALGILSLFALLGHNPVAKLNEDDMLSAKAEFGTYQCMCANERIPMSLIELLRGLLSDEDYERWNMDALDNWLNGQKKSPIQRRNPPKPKTSLNSALATT